MADNQKSNGHTPEEHEFGFDTLAVHAGQQADPTTGSRAMPIYQTTSYVFEDTDTAAALFDLQEVGNIYTRIMNPTTGAFEERVAALEGGVGAVAFGSGLGAQTSAFMTVLKPGDHVVTSHSLYGGTTAQLKNLFGKMSVDYTFVDPGDMDAWSNAVTDKTRLFYAETIGNPNSNILDIEAVSKVAHDNGVPLMIDNTFATPYLCRPIEWGADIVVHSATKFIGGHGTSIGGIVVDGGNFDWANGKFETITAPSESYHGLQFHDTFGPLAFAMKLRAETLRDIGAAISPFNSFMFLIGLETLSLRMDRHVENAQKIAEYLNQHPAVASVSYPGLPGSPDAELVKKYMPKGPGAIFTFDIKGGRDAGKAFIEALDLWSHLANVGDAKSLVIHPASTTHRQLSEQELEEAGITVGTIRLSVGIETPEDLVWDLGQALEVAMEYVPDVSAR